MMPGNRSRTARPFCTIALLGFVLGAGGLCGVLAAAAAYRLDWLPVVTALRLAEWAAYGALSGFVLALVGVVRTWPGRGRRGLPLAALGLAAALPVVAAGAWWEYAERAYPPIHDVSTDIEDPPVFWEMPNPTDYPGGETARLQREAYPELQPLEVTAPEDEAYAAALAVARDNGWEIVAEEAGEGRIEAVDTSFLFGFEDEVVIRVTPLDDGARIDVRSRSRIGRIDRGVNAERVRAFLAALRDRLR